MPTEYRYVPLQPKTRDRLRSAKRGGDSYTDVVEKALDQFDPEAVDY